MLNQFPSRFVQVACRHRQAAARGKVRVETQALGIGHRQQEQIEGAGLMAELIDVAITDQALVHPAELLGQLPEFG